MMITNTRRRGRRSAASSRLNRRAVVASTRTARGRRRGRRRQSAARSRATADALPRRSWRCRRRHHSLFFSRIRISSRRVCGLFKSISQRETSFLLLFSLPSFLSRLSLSLSLWALFAHVPFSLRALSLSLQTRARSHSRVRFSIVFLFFVVKN